MLRKIFYMGGICKSAPVFFNAVAKFLPTLISVLIHVDLPIY